MSAVDDLRLIASGVRPVGGLLQNCRLEMAGQEDYGEEAILERFRGAALDLSGAEALRGRRHLALIAGEVALVADLYGERVGRVWVVGVARAGAPEPAVAVAFDADLAQARGGVLADVADHPELRRADHAALIEAGGRLVEEATRPGYRARAFLIRAWSAEGRGVGLFALHRLGPGPVRPAGFGYAVAITGGDGPRLLRDPAGEAAVDGAPWRPRV